MSSTNSSAPASAIPPEVIETVIQGFAKAIRPSVGYVLIGSIFAGTLIPIIIALFYFSTPATRTKPVFVLNVVSLLIGIAIAVWNNQLELTAILNPGTTVGWKDTTGFAVCFALAPWLSEVVLTFRLLVVFPPRRTPKWKLALVFAFPIAIKAVRLSAIIVYYNHFAKAIRDIDVALQASEAVDFSRSVYSKIEWFGQIFDNLYSSVLFIWKLYQSHIFKDMDGQRVSFGSSDSLSSRIKALFWIAVGNFVFPVIFDIVLIIDVYVDPNYHTNTPYLLFANYYIVVIGVVFATLWSSSFNYMKERNTAEGSLSWHVARPGTIQTGQSLPAFAPRSLATSSDSGVVEGVKTRGWDTTSDSDREATKGEAIPLHVVVHKSTTPEV